MRRIVWCDHCHISVIPESPITAGYILLTNIDYDSCYCHSLIIIECDGCLHAHLERPRRAQRRKKYNDIPLRYEYPVLIPRRPLN